MSEISSPEFYAELEMGVPDEPEAPTVFLGRMGDSAQLVLAVSTPTGGAMLAQFAPNLDLTTAVAIIGVILPSSDIVGASPAVARILDNMLQNESDAANDDK